MLTILVTGAAGFIGSNLIDELIKEGNRIIGIDNFNDYYHPEIKEKNIKEVYTNISKLGIARDSFLLYRVDITDKENMNLIFKKHRIDIVIHLAAMAGVRPSIDKPELYSDVNIGGTLNILELIGKNRISKLIFGSSSSVYGNNIKIPFNESSIVDYPISPYAFTKKAGELLCYTYHNLYDIDIACLRFFTVYGPRQRPDLAIHKFIKLIMEDRPIYLYGDGKTARDYTYIDDIVDGISKTVKWIHKVEGKYEIFNLGSNNSITLNNMVATLENIIKKKIQIIRISHQPGDVDRTLADISKAKEVLGYFPKKKFEDGIKDFLNWYKEESRYSF